jgi:hypothetical protein
MGGLIAPLKAHGNMEFVEFSFAEFPDFKLPTMQVKLPFTGKPKNFRGNG